MLETTVYSFARRGKGQNGATYDAAVFGLRVSEDSPLTYAHIKNPTLDEVNESLSAFDIDLCLAALIGADVILKQNASGGGIRQMMKARLLNDGIGNRLEDKARQTAINGLATMIHHMIQFGSQDADAAYSMAIMTLKPEMRPRD